MENRQKTETRRSLQIHRLLGSAGAGLLLFGFGLLPQTVLAQSSLADGSMMRMSQKSFNETVTALTRAIEGENLMVISTVDGQRMMRMAGANVGPMQQIFYFHPRFMRRVLEANDLAAVQIPLKFIVMERPDGKVGVRYLKPSTVLGQYKGEEQIAAELDGIVENIVAEATK